MIRRRLGGIVWSAVALFLLAGTHAVQAQMLFGHLSEDQITGAALNANDRSVVILIHGWTGKEIQNAPEDKFSDAEDHDWFQLVQALKTRLTSTGTKLLLYHWESDASTGPALDCTLDTLCLVPVLNSVGFSNAASAAAHAFSNGRLLASSLAGLAPDLRRVTLVAHSAGAWAAYRAADKLLQTNPYVVVNVVLLDPFVPGVPGADPTLVTPLTKTAMESLASRPFADRIYRLENYFTVDMTDDHFPGVGATGATSQIFSWRAQDISQRVDYGGFPGSPYGYGGPLPIDPFGAGHSGPKRFYADTVTAATLGATVPVGLANAPWSFSALGFYRGLVFEDALFPSIAEQPQAPTQPIPVGASVSLSVTASRADSYQWFKGGLPYDSASSTSATLLFNSVATGDAGIYVVRLKNSAGYTFSEQTVLRVVGAAAQISQQAKLVASNSIGTPWQGYAVSIASDGNTAIVGGRGDNANFGAAWIWTRSGGVWTEGPKLVGSGATGSAPLQGFSVAISADGSTAIVGGPLDSGFRGAAWVFRRNGGAWSQEGPKLSSSDAGPNTEQGASVALSADGSTAIIGGVLDGGNAGAAWVWVRTGSVWTQQWPKLAGSNAVGNSEQGNSVAISADGSTAIVGGPGDNSRSGAAWIWTRSGSLWTQEGPKLVGSGANNSPNGALQGFSVAIAADGNTAIVGGYGDNHYSGAAWIFTRSSGVWTQQGDKLVGTDATGAVEGQHGAVAISDDGNTAIVGEAGIDSFAGALWVWKREGGLWSQQGPKLRGGGSVGNPLQGYSVSISGDGGTAIAGGYYDSSGTGAAWTFLIGPSVLTGPSAPSGVAATAVSNTRVDVAWSTVPGALSYQIFRQSSGGGDLLVGTSSTTSFSDTSATANSAYAYSVRAVNDAGAGSISAEKVVTTLVFTDDPLTAGTGVSAVHLSQLRTAVNSLRLLAGFSAATFTDTAAPGTPIKAIHILELRTAIDEARQALGLSVGGYTDPSLTGVAIKAVHIQELRDRVK